MFLLVKDVPDSLHREFRVFCAMNDKTVRETVLDLMGKCAAQVRHVMKKDQAA
jgi:hypothetical protein